MVEIKQTREQLELRLGEINKQLNRVNQDLHMELDRDPEEQAIEIEHNEVSVSRESNLRKELDAIEDKLLDYEQK